MEDSYLSSNFDILTPYRDNTDNLNHFSLDIDDSIYSLHKCDKYISTENNDKNPDDKYSNLYECEKIFNKEQEIILNPNQNINNIIDKEETKRQLRLKRNRESAKQGRVRKKIYFENLLNQLNELQIQNSLLLNIVLKCPKCKEEYDQTKLKIDDKNNNYILSNENSISGKKKLLFMTAITVLFIFNIFNVITFNLKTSKIELKNNLMIQEENELLINKLKSPNKDEAMLIHLGEYYSLTTREKVNFKSDLDKEINKNIKIYNNNRFDIDNINQTHAKNCVKCMVEFDNNSIKMGGDEITLFLVDRLLSKNFMDNIDDGIFPEINFEKENNRSDTFSKVFALKCKIIAYSINDVYSKNIDSIS